MSDATPPPDATPLPPPHHGRIVVRTCAIWALAHLLVWIVLAIPSYAACLGPAPTSVARSDCGFLVALVALAIGGLQLVYGPLVILVIQVRHLLTPERRTAVSQGLIIGIALVLLLHTVLCFGVAFSA